MTGSFGAVLVLGHNALDGIAPSAFGALAPLWHLAHVPGIVYAGAHSVVVVAYVLVPWVGVTALGFALGPVFDWDARRRRQWLWRAGLGLTLGFLALRALNVYGDPRPWSLQPSALWTVLSFLDLNKYPPSLLFLLMTLGPALLLLGLFDGGVPRLLRRVPTFGKVPLFFFIVHFYVIHLLALAACWFRYGNIAGMFRSPDLAHFPFTQPPGWNAGLPTVYALWIMVVVALYPLCRWYAGIKRRHHAWWLGYL